VHVVNIHERRFAAARAEVGALIDGLASTKDRLWPSDAWPRMVFDGPLAVGARGGHGPIRYQVEAFDPSQRVRFRFLGPSGFDGYHAFDVVELGTGHTLLRHTLEMTATGLALLTWPLIFRPLHDALIEDSLARAEAAMGQEPAVVAWPAGVSVLRWVLTAGRAGPQVVPRPQTNVVRL
jgi:hypothetical protein